MAGIVPSSTGKPPAKGEMHEEEDDDDDRTPAKIAVVDIASGKKIREITAGPETEGIEFSRDGSQIIVTNEADNTITVHDFTSGDLLKTIKAENYGLRPRGIKNRSIMPPHSVRSALSVTSPIAISTIPVGIAT